MTGDVPAGGAWRHRWALLTVASTLVLIFIGGLVTSTGAGLSVPDWPLSYGMLMPPMAGNVRYEHGHRLAATAVGLLTLILALWTARSEPRAWVRRLAWIALGAVMAQGILGGLTVLFLLPAPISVAHAVLAQTFFCLAIALAYVTSREWLSAGGHAGGGREADGRAGGEREAGGRQAGATGVRNAAILATSAIYVQLVLGGIMRHIGAGLAIPDFPLAFGRMIPALDSPAIAVHFAHRVGAALVFVCVLRLFLVAHRSRDRRFGGSALLALALAVLQIALGAATVLSTKAVLPTTAHVATGAALLGTCWWATLRSFRMTARMRAPALAANPA